ncbi:hypothetical protein Ahy_A07g033331 isoform A [Arachis hypogaea]|uniref:Uncharacterized protein n=1 Tax=Arachis hypogaea TaxID=3818 RepID=A0A445C8Y1_ARAHY|nr:hypothetical protein Ahy_A07g033331 isoform A [Arachis hypogaea]
MALQHVICEVSPLPIKIKARYHFTSMRERALQIVVYHNGEIIRNTYEGMSFACENTFLFVVSFTITFTKLQCGLFQSIESDLLKRESNILYRTPVVVFGGLIQFEVMLIVDKTNIQWMFHIHQQTQAQHLRIELYVEFEHIVVDKIQDNPDVQDDRAEA